MRGRWLCKMEFQRGGWVHWHLVVIGFDRIDQALLEKCWRHGFVWVRRAGEAELRYVCKYVGKAGSFPAFVYQRPIRSVKIIRTSPGFWSVDGAAERADSVSEDGGRAVAYDAEPVEPRLPIFKSYGQMIQEGEERTVCRERSAYELGRDRYTMLKLPIWEVLRVLKTLGVRLQEASPGWMGVAVNSKLWWGYVMGRLGAALLRRDGSNAGRAGRADQREAAGTTRLVDHEEQGATDPARLHLIHCANPPSWARWLTWAIEWEYGWRDPSSGLEYVE